MADTPTDITTQQNITSGRFQALCGTLLYSRSDRTSCGITGGENTSGVLLTNGVAQNFRDPDSPGLDAFPWWAEYGVDFNDGNAAHHFHDFAADNGTDGAGSLGQRLHRRRPGQ